MDSWEYFWWGYKDAEQQREIDRLRKTTVTGDVFYEKVAILENRVENLILLNQAMWSLLQEKNGLSEKDLLEKVEELDLADGKADGRLNLSGDKKPWKCEKCQKENSPRFRFCVKCDAPGVRLGASGAFKKIT